MFLRYVVISIIQLQYRHIGVCVTRGKGGIAISTTYTYMSSRVALQVFFLIQVSHLHVPSCLVALWTCAWRYEMEPGCAWMGGTSLALQMRTHIRLLNCLQPSVLLPQFSWDKHCCLQTWLIRWTTYSMLVFCTILLYTLNCDPQKYSGKSRKSQ